jgi:hypothetical protein
MRELFEIVRLSAIGVEQFYLMPLLDGNLRKLIEDGIDPDKVAKLFTTALAGIEDRTSTGLMAS